MMNMVRKLILVWTGKKMAKVTAVTTVFPDTGLAPHSCSVQQLRY